MPRKDSTRPQTNIMQTFAAATYITLQNTFPPGSDLRLSRSQGRRLITFPGIVCWLVGYLTSWQHASVSQGWICSDNCTCPHIEIEVADQTFYIAQLWYTDTEPTLPSTDLQRQTLGRVKIPAQAGFKLTVFRSQGGRLNH